MARTKHKSRMRDTSADMTDMTRKRFCPTCGTLLKLDPENDRAICMMDGFTRPMKELLGITITTTSTPADWQRRYGVEPLIKTEASLSMGKERAKVDEECPRCKHPELLFYTMQLRSADEGQTVFYECPKCNYKYNVNT